jgi:hypothetical protein
LKELRVVNALPEQGIGEITEKWLGGRSRHPEERLRIVAQLDTLCVPLLKEGLVPIFGRRGVTF